MSSEGVTAAIFDVVDTAGDDIGPAVAIGHRDLFRSDRDRGARSGHCLLRHALERDIRPGQRDAVAGRAHEIELEHIAITHEARDMEIRRLRVDLGRRPDLLHDAVLHHDDAVGQRQRLVLVVRHVDRRAAELAMDPADLGAGLDPQLRVEVRQRLVHQDQRRLDDDGARDRHPLLLAAGELTGQLVRLPGRAERA